jgi:polar amino acid transport system permease protein
MVSIVIPQVFRVILPPLTSEFVQLFEDSSLVLVLGVTLEERELSKFVRDLSSTTANSTPILVACLCYLLVTIPLGFVVRGLEAKAEEAVK